ncbi:uncharacterized protein BUCNMO_280 [Buchnera aphidicola (Nipponaphis monzeni)]|uniref:Uncharacterized protein n=1 Tax=Buchnera aphidicola (Nipponaphis monzeni) TaxID=2495405 RepID=A0A455TAC8_9GAMM|nr:hypothetical protein [Buchnera aphidicola]BBI01286.1 uncharacterized protein BUCNMO_280 [Buchnera aphidicola (Nipponaphis monzeni)]
MKKILNLVKVITKKKIIICYKYCVCVLILINVIFLSRCQISNNVQNKVNMFHVKSNKNKYLNTENKKINIFLNKIIIQALQNAHISFYENKLLIDIVYNNKNYLYNRKNDLENVRKMINKYFKFIKIIKISEIDDVLKKFKLTLNSNSLSKDKVLLIAKYMNVRYILFNNVIKNLEHILINTELVTVDDKEIIYNKLQFFNIKRSNY